MIFFFFKMMAILNFIFTIGCRNIWKLKDSLFVCGQLGMYCVDSMEEMNFGKYNLSCCVESEDTQ